MLFSELKGAEEDRDGWRFCEALQEINALFGNLVQAPTDMPCIKEVQDRILQESYNRLIRPNAHVLKQYTPFSNNVYGELMPAFMDEIIRLTQPTSSSLFLYLGCGVGTVITQVSLRSGCTSFGVELMPTVATLARDLMAQTLLRCNMWGIPCGTIQAEEGDMLENEKVLTLVRKADVICVNNLAFHAERLFLHLDTG